MSRGNDTIDNSGKITATSVAEALSANVAYTTVGVAGAVSAAKAESRSAAIDSGAGNDDIINSSELVSTSVATAIPLSLAVLVGPEGGGGVGFSSSGATAVSEAVGIVSDSQGSNLEIQEYVEVTGKAGTEGGFAVTQDLTIKSTVANNDDIIDNGRDFDDTIENSGDITVTSVAEAPSVSASFSLIGATGVASSSEAQSRAVAIDAGAGNDEIVNTEDIDNTRELVATSVANANTVNISIAPLGGALAADTVWDGGTTAISEAIGISGDGQGKDTLFENNIKVDDGDIVIFTNFESKAVTGDDDIFNDMKITATSVAVAPSIGVAFAVGPAATMATATATSRAAAIDAGAGGDEVENYGELVATSIANADAVSLTAGGMTAATFDSFWNGGTTAKSRAVGISGDGDGLNDKASLTLSRVNEKIDMNSTFSSMSAGGDDTITNDAKITATSVAVAPSYTAAASAGAAAAMAAATADASAVAIDGGAGDDTITNRVAGELVATAVANADTVSVATMAGPFGAAVAGNGFFSGGVTAQSNASGISGDGQGRNQVVSGTVEVNGFKDVHMDTLISNTAAAGTDTITNDGKITVSSVAVTPAITNALALNGVAAAISTATAEADGTGIDGGAGEDTVTNYGELEVTSVAVAAAVNVSMGLFGVNVASDAVWQGGTTARAKAVGISGDSINPDDTIITTIDAVDGITDIETIVSKIYAGGKDTIINEGNITATSVVVAPSVSSTITVAGIAGALSTATGESTAIAIDGGAGNDTITNRGVLNTVSVANADAITISSTGVGVSGSSDAVWNGGTTATAKSVGISGDSLGNNETSRGYMEFEGDSVLMGLAFESEAVSGDDKIYNYNDITTTSVAVTPSIGFAATGIGVAAAVSTSTANAEAAAINAGDGGDYIENTGKLTVTSVANADAVSIAGSVIGVSAAGTSAWDGGTKANAEAVGIKGDGLAKETSEYQVQKTGDDILLSETTLKESTGGDDTIFNYGDIKAIADAITVTVDVALSGIGVAGAVSTATADGYAAAIDAGAGSDTITNTSNLTADSEAVAVSVGVGFSVLGGAGGLSAVWDGGTKARSEAVGISGDGKGEKETRIREIKIVGTDVDIQDEIVETQAVGGDDDITNTGTIKAYSTATSPEVQVAATFAGISEAVSTSTADALATVIDGGAGNDTITAGNATGANIDNLVSQATATAVAVGVEVTGLGDAGGIDSMWEGGTTALASAFGINGGEGADTINNYQTIEADSKAEAVSVEVAADIAGVAVAVSAAEAESNTTAIFGGDGGDTINNYASLSSTSEAIATGVSVAVNLAGYAGTDTSTHAVARSTGIDGGDRDDASIINNTFIYSKSRAEANAAEIDVNLIGASYSNAVLDGETKADAFAYGIRGGGGSDSLTNAADGWIIAVSEAETTADTVDVKIAGYSNADVGTIVHSEVVGMDGGTGDDTIVNDGSILGNYFEGLTGKATSIASSSVVPVNLVGATEANLSASASTDGAGMAGGDGNDTVKNNNYINMYAKAEAPAITVGVTMAGDLNVDAATTLEADASGIRGGSGMDTLENNGEVYVNTYGEGKVTGVTVNLAGTGAADASTNVTAKAQGMEGEADKDTMTNRGSLDIKADAYGDGSAVTVTLAGKSDADASLNVSSDVTGMDGGTGADIIINTSAGGVDVDSLAKGKAGSVTVTLAGSAPGEAGTVTSAYGAGIDGGNGNNTITNQGILNVLADADGDASGVSVSLAGSAAASARSEVNSEAKGITAGSGYDTVANSGSIIAKGLADLKATGTSVNLAGTSEGSTDGETDASAIGIETGYGNDTITNTGLVDVDAESSVTQSGYGFTLAGTASGSNLMMSEAEAFGLDLGSGNDGFTSSTASDIDIDVTATLSSSSSSTGIFGTSAAGGESGARASGYGILGGYGHDTISLWGDMYVDAVTTLTLTGSSFEFGGTGSTSGELTADSEVVGISSGSGRDTIYHYGYMIVDADSLLSISGKSNVGFGSANSSSTTRSKSTATGISSESWNDTIDNFGDITAYATTSASSTNSSYVFGGGASSNSALTANSSATGINSGSGNDYVLNRNYIYTWAYGWTDGNSGTDSTFGTSSSGGSVKTTTTATGIYGNSGDDYVENRGNIYAKGYSWADSSRSSDTGWLFGKGYAKTNSYAYSTGYGINMGSGEDEVVNKGVIDVYMMSYGLATATADGADVWNGDASTDAYAYANSTASGIYSSAGSAGNSSTITNETTGEIDVTSYSYSYTYSKADGDGFDGDGYAEADSVSRSYAYGIRTKKSGNDQILNNGSITVSAIANSVTSTDVDGDWGGSAKEYSRPNGRSYAYGIYSDGGNNYVENNGSIMVTAKTDNVSNKSIPVYTANAVGIKTGDGNDTIINNGSITTREKEYSNGVLLPDIPSLYDNDRKGDGIDAGAGSDTVILKPGSSIACDVILGTGNDTILFSGDAYVSGMTRGGDGEDTLILAATGSQARAQQGFETVVSFGDNSISTAGSRDIKNFELNAGVLKIDGDYQFDGTNTLTTTIHPDGSSGVLKVDGDVELKGELNVKKGFGVYSDNTAFSMVSADGLAGDFNESDLPNSAILTFNKERTGADLDLKVDVASFTTVADTSSEASIGEYLDRLSPISSGELYNIIAEYQGLSRSEFDQAFASVNPEPYSNSVKTYMDTTIKSFDMIQSRLNTLRTSAAYAPYANQFQSRGSFAGLNGIPQAQFGLWFEGFTTAFYDDETRLTDPSSHPENFSSLGFDVAVSKNFVLGFGRDYSQISTTTAFTDGMNMAYGHKDFVYSSFNHDDLYMNMAAFYGNESYNQQRDIGVGVYEGTTVSEHASDSFSSYVEMGRLISSYNSIFQPFASLRYMNLEEDGFTESGGGVLALKIKDADRELLTSHLGFRASKLWVFDQWTVMPEVSLAWRYHIKSVDYSTTASFVSMPDQTFLVKGEDDDDHALDIGAALNIGKLGKFDFSMNFNGEVLTDKEKYDLGWEIKYRF